MKKRKIFFILFMLLVVNITKSQMIHPDDYIIKHNKGWGFNNINTEPWKYKHQTKKKHASYRNLRFTIKFGDDCEYVMPYHGCASEQNRFQKVVTLCTHQRLTSKNHLKLGWRWNPVSGKVEVAFYGHLNHLSDNKNGREHIYLIKSVDTDEPLNIVMVIAKKGFYLRAGEKSAWIVRDVFSWKPNNDTEDNNDPGNEKTYMRANSYFSECEDPAFGVPHRMHFYLNNIYVDDPDIKEYTDNTDLTFFDTYMQYPDQGPYNYYASNDMVLPVPNQGASNRLPFTSPFFVIESGNTVNLVAGNSISLKQGFWAKAGCTFSAKIGSNPFKFSNSTACGFLKKNFTQENSPVAGNSIAFFNQSGTEITAISPAITDSLGYFAFDSAQIAGLDTNMLVTLNTREKQIDTGDVGFKTIKNWIRTNPIQLHIEDLGVAASNITYDSINPIMSYLIGNDTNFYYFFDEDNMYSNIYTDEYYSCLNDSVRLYANAYGGIKPYTYHWDFDNGNTSSLMKPVVKFNTAGIYNILLVATDAKGQKDTDLLVVKLIEPVQAAFDLVSPFCLYDTLKIINNTAGDSTTSYIWIVSNGDTIISNNLQYKFNQDGNFIITLIAIDSLCCSDTLTRQISILDCNLLSGTLTENPACGGAPVAGDTLALMKNDTAVASAITDENGAFSFNSADLAQLNTAALYGINTKSGFPLDSGQQKTIIQWQSESPLSLTLKNVNQQWVARYNGADSLNDVTSALDLQGNIYVTGATSSNITAYDMLTIKYDSSGTQKWAATYRASNNYKNDNARAITVAASGNVYITGESDTTGVSLLTTLSYTTSGTLRWIRKYQPSTCAQASAKCILQDHAGNIIVGGTSSCSSPSGKKIFTILKYDTNGNLLWSANYTGPATVPVDYLTALAVDDSNNVYASGFSQGVGTNYDMATVKYNSSGTQLWVARYDNADNGNDYAYSNTVDNNGNIIVTGYSHRSSGNDEIAVIKYNPAGTRNWVSVYNTDTHDYALKALCNDSNEVYIGGHTGSTGSSGMLALKYNASGSLLWQNYSLTSNMFNFKSAALDNADNIYITGTTAIISNVKNTDITTQKLNSEGEIQWTVTYNGPAGNVDFPTQIIISANGNVYVSANSIGNSTYYDFTTLKYSQCLSTAENLRTTNPNVSTNIINTVTENSSILVIPNPNNGNMQVAYEIPENTTGTPASPAGRFEVYNMMGEKLFSYSLFSGKNTFSISRSDLNQGIYFYRATAGNKLIATDKIVVIK